MWINVDINVHLTVVGCSLIKDNHDVAMDSIIHIVQHMTPAQRSEVMRILATPDIV